MKQMCFLVLCYNQSFFCEYTDCLKVIPVTTCLMFCNSKMPVSLCIRQYALFFALIHVMCTFPGCVCFFMFVSHISSYIFSFSKVKSPFLQLDYYCSNCRVKQGKLYGSVDRPRQVCSDYSVTLIYFHCACKNSKTFKSICFSCQLASTHSHFLIHMSFFLHLHLGNCQKLLFKVPHK